MLQKDVTPKIVEQKIQVSDYYRYIDFENIFKKYCLPQY